LSATKASLVGISIAARLKRSRHGLPWIVKVDDWPGSSRPFAAVVARTSVLASSTARSGAMLPSSASVTRGAMAGWPSVKKRMSGLCVASNSGVDAVRRDSQ
jgi:hypothetical protein